VSVDAARGISASLDACATCGRIHNALVITEDTAAGLNILATSAYVNIDVRRARA
jgi:hypothetical protein